VDYWRGLYDLFRSGARGRRLVHGHVRLCNSGGNPGPRWYISAGLHAAILEKHATSPLILSRHQCGRPSLRSCQSSGFIATSIGWRDRLSPSCRQSDMSKRSPPCRPRQGGGVDIWISDFWQPMALAGSRCRGRRRRASAHRRASGWRCRGSRPPRSSTATAKAFMPA